MSYDNKALEFDREHIWIIEMDLEYCTRTYGSSPCLASGPEKCYNTFDSCQFLSAYDGSATNTKTYRFCSEKSPQPIGLEAIPIVKSVNVSSSTIDPSGGLGVRSNVGITFTDLPGSDIGIDKYLSERTYDPFERGSYWTKLRARNPNYQYRPLRVLSGYLNEDGTYEASNFKERVYVVDSMDVSRGIAMIKGKDPLKLATMNKAQVPKPNSGQLTTSLNSTATTFSVGSGEGAQYGSAGFLVIDREVMSFVRSGDSFTVVRAQYNTAATTHSNDATVQQCYVQTGVNVDVIVADLLINFCGIDSSLINQTTWASETSVYLEENMNGIITKPTDVFKELKLLAQSAPHYLWWDESASQIRFTALKAPPANANVISEDLILADKIKVADAVEKRISTVLVNFGQFDPTLKLDEDNNYQVSYVRQDVDSIAKYGSDLVEKINTRWIGSSGKSAAIKVATLRGRRFANIPREAAWSVDPAYRIGLGGSITLNHRDMVDYSGLPQDTIFQILSEKEGANEYTYTGLEFAYGEELAGDSAVGTDVVFISTNKQNVNAADEYIAQIGPITGNVVVRFVIDTNVVVSSSSAATYAFELGNWSAATTVDITLEISSGAYIVGKGGIGSSSTGTAGTAGGPAINLTENITLVNSNVIGGGGGGGGAETSNGHTAAGGGGAGITIGSAGTNDATGTGTVTENTAAQNGTLTNGGNGGSIRYTISGEPFFLNGGKGGDLGVNGNTVGSAGGAAGKAINLNGNTITYDVTGTISGTVS